MCCFLKVVDYENLKNDGVPNQSFSNSFFTMIHQFLSKKFIPKCLIKIIKILFAQATDCENIKLTCK